MSGSLRYETVESGRFVLEQLYLDNREEQFFTCKIKVPLPRPDTMGEGTLQLDLKRIYESEHSYETSNKDRIYRTRARFTGDMREFDVDVIIRSREVDFIGATISVAGEALEIFEIIKEQ